MKIAAWLTIKGVVITFPGGTTITFSVTLLTTCCTPSTITLAKGRSIIVRPPSCGKERFVRGGELEYFSESPLPHFESDGGNNKHTST